MRLGLMGGTFDPIHLGHLLAAEEALDRCQLDEVLFVPAGRPWMKGEAGVSPAHHRINMTALAVAYNPRFSVSSIEMDREGPTYTVDTLEELFRENPSRELFLIVGADSVAQMGQWKGPERIQELCTVVAVPRPGYDPPCRRGQAGGLRPRNIPERPAYGHQRDGGEGKGVQGASGAALRSGGGGGVYSAARSIPGIF